TPVRRGRRSRASEGDVPSRYMIGPLFRVLEMIRSREGASAPGVEKFSVSSAGERWLQFLSLEHATLPLPVALSRQDDDGIVRRSSTPGRRISAGRIPSDQAAALFLQAASACAFLQAFGFWLDEEDLTDAVYDRVGGAARLWLSRTPAGVIR